MDGRDIRAVADGARDCLYPSLMDTDLLSRVSDLFLVVVCAVALWCDRFLPCCSDVPLPRSRPQSYRFELLDMHAELQQVRPHARLLVVGIALAVKRVIPSFVCQYKRRCHPTNQLRSTLWIASRKPNTPNTPLIIKWSRKAQFRSNQESSLFERFPSRKWRATLMGSFPNRFRSCP